MKKSSIRVIAIILSLIMIMISGCEKERDRGDGPKGTENGLGRFVEEELQLPDGEPYILGMNILSDNTVRIIGATGIYDSKDGGHTWEKSRLSDLLLENNILEFIGTIDKEGNVFLMSVEGEQTVYHYVHHQGEIHKVDLQLPEMDSEDDEPDIYDENGVYTEYNNYLTQIMFADNGNILATDKFGEVYLIDARSGEILKTYMETNAEDVSLAYMGEKLAIYTGSGIDFYNLGSGNFIETDEVLNSFFHSLPSDTDNQLLYGGIGGNGFIMKQGASEEELFFLNSTGLYRYTSGSAMVEEIMNGSLYSMSTPGFFPNSMLIKEDNSFLVNYLEISSGSVNFKLMNYSYDPELSTVPSTELTIYSLEDNRNIRQAISKLRNLYPDYYIKLEVGMTGDDALTVSDAIRTLNTDILAGRGPDILLLDDMPGDSYIEKGLLYNLEEILKEVLEENNFFTNIVNVMNTDQGTYMIPTRFTIPIINGSLGDLEGIYDLDILSDKIHSLRLDHPNIKTIIGMYTETQITELLYSIYSDTLIKEDGTLDENRLTEFLTKVNEINKQNVYENPGWKGSNEFAQHVPTIIDQQQLLFIIELSDLSLLNSLLSVNKLVDWDYQLLQGTSGNIFTPKDMIGINAKSKNIEACQEVVKALLSLDLQKISQSPGFPVNITAFDLLCTESQNTEIISSFFMVSESGEYTTIIVEPGTPQDYKQLKEYLDMADTPVNTNKIIQNAIVEGASSYVGGDTTVEEAVSNIIQKVNLYLAE